MWDRKFSFFELLLCKAYLVLGLRSFSFFPLGFYFFFPTFVFSFLFSYFYFTLTLNSLSWKRIGVDKIQGWNEPSGIFLLNINNENTFNWKALPNKWIIITYLYFSLTECRFLNLHPSGVGVESLHFQVVPRWCWCCWYRHHMLRTESWDIISWCE